MDASRLDEPSAEPCAINSMRDLGNGSACSMNGGEKYGVGSSKEEEKGFPVGRTFIIKDTPRLRCF